MNVLITSASRKVWLIQAFREALEGRGQVIAADITLQAAAMHLADQRIVVPRSDDPGFINSMLTICSERDVGLLVPTRDDELPVFAEAAPRFNEIDVRVHVPDPAALDICVDKTRFHAFCVEQGHPVAERIVHPTEAHLPLFVRPRRGKGSVGSFRVDDAVRLRQVLDRSEDVILNRLIDAPEFTIDVFLTRDGRPVSSVPRERVQVVSGESYIGRTVDDDRLQESAAELCADLRLTGHNTVQAFRWQGGLAFIEVNPRLGGGAALGFAAGAPTPRWLVQEVFDEPLHPEPGTYVPDLVMLRYTQDVFVPGDQLSP